MSASRFSCDDYWREGAIWAAPNGNSVYDNATRLALTRWDDRRDPRFWWASIVGLTPDMCAFFDIRWKMQRAVVDDFGDLVKVGTEVGR
jgi:hypothetical protein